MLDGTAICPAWPELLKPATAAAMLDVSESTFRAIFPVLAARHGLKVVGFGGPKFSRANLLDVIGRLSERELDIQVDKAGGKVRIGGEAFPIKSTRSGKSGRGRPVNGTNAKNATHASDAPNGTHTTNSKNASDAQPASIANPVHDAHTANTTSTKGTVNT